jgi:rare lipoprotein A
MRTLVLVALATITFGALTLGPASANGTWQCMSPAFACGGAPVVKKHRAYGYANEHTVRRTTKKRKPAHVAKHQPSKPKAERQAKVTLPEHKPAAPQKQAMAKPEQTPVLEKKPQVAERKDAATAAPRADGRVASTQHGLASYYWQGQMTASGKRFNPNALTAAHRNLPFGTRVRVTNKRNGKSVVVTINDRGPFIRGRIIDLSSAAAGVIGMKGAGIVPVKVVRFGG